MDSKDLNNAVFDYLNLSYAKPTKDATQETVSPIMVTPSGDLKVGQEYLAMLSLTVEGENLYELNVPNTGKSKRMEVRLSFRRIYSLNVLCCTRLD